MNSQTALNIFDSAISVMCEQARMQARADDLCIEETAFSSFADLLNAKGDYRPSLTRARPATRELGALYDAAMQARGDSRRAFMYGTPSRKGSIIDRGNWDSSECWYARGDRRTFWDKYTRQWIAFDVCDRGYQQGAAEFYPNSEALLLAEECHA